MMWRMVTLMFLTAFSMACSDKAAIEARRAALDAEMKAATEEVRKIVNQPVEPLLHSQDMRVTVYRPGWYHEGASKPDFSKDVRTTQDLSYGTRLYVTSNLNPGIAWRGSQVEFNPNTKYFYEDITVPKKKLSEEEMIEINRLYSIIARCERELAEL